LKSYNVTYKNMKFIKTFPMKKKTANEKLIFMPPLCTLNVLNGLNVLLLNHH
jgi:hypothetical protein